MNRKERTAHPLSRGGAIALERAETELARERGRHA